MRPKKSLKQNKTNCFSASPPFFSEIRLSQALENTRCLGECNTSRQQEIPPPTPFSACQLWPRTSVFQLGYAPWRQGLLGKGCAGRGWGEGGRRRLGQHLSLKGKVKQTARQASLNQLSGTDPNHIQPQCQTGQSLERVALMVAVVTSPRHFKANNHHASSGADKNAEYYSCDEKVIF